MREASNLLSQQLVSEFPTESVRKAPGDFRRSTAVFPFDCDDADHDLNSYFESAFVEANA